MNIPSEQGATPASGAIDALHLTLDDIAVLLVQLEPSDRDDLEAIRRRLEVLGDESDTGSSVATRKLIREAARKLAFLLEGGAGDALALLAAVGRLVNAASAQPRSGVATTASGAPDDGASLPSFEPARGYAHSIHPSVALPLPTPPAVPKGRASVRPLVLVPPDVDTVVLGEFVTECHDYIASAEAALLELEKDPHEKEAIGTVIRAFYTIKGVAAMLETTAISHLAHQAESLLSAVRDGSTQLTATLANLSLRSIDMLKVCIGRIQEALAGGANEIPEGYQDLLYALAHPETALSTIPARALALSMPPAPNEASARTIERIRASRRVPPAAARASLRATGKALRMTLNPPAPDAHIALKSLSQPAAERKKAPAKRPGEAGVESSIRVRTDRLDRFIDLVGELVIAHSMVAQDDTILRGAPHELQKKVTHSGKIVRELQELSISLRMVPLKVTFKNMQRVVRDIARKAEN